MKILKICGKVLLIIVIIIAVILVIGLLFLEFYPSVGDTPDKEKQKEYGAKTDLYYEKQFHNELDFEVMTGEASPKSDRTVPENKLPAETPDTAERAREGERQRWEIRQGERESRDRGRESPGKGGGPSSRSLELTAGINTYIGI